MEILLAGEDHSYLTTLAIHLTPHCDRFTVVTDSASLQEALVDSTPDVVILDHIEPMDLITLNPRLFGYEGPVVVLIEQQVPAQLLLPLDDPLLLIKPFSADRLLELLD